MYVFLSFFSVVFVFVAGGGGVEERGYLGLVNWRSADLTEEWGED